MFNVIRTSLPAFLLLLCHGQAEAYSRSDESSVADLLGVYEAATQSDPQLSGARHAYQAQLEAVPQARAGLLPEITAGATSESTRLVRDEPSLTRDRSGTTFRANLSQPLFRADRWYQLKAAQASVAQAGLELAAKEQTLVFNSAQASFEVLRQQDSLAAAKAEEAALLRQREQAQGRLEDGASSITSKVIQSSETAVVKAIHVHDGQEVKAGELLLELDPTSAEADVGRAQSDLLAARVDSARAGAMLEAIDHKQAPHSLSVALKGADPQHIMAAERWMEAQYHEYRSSLDTTEAEIA